MYIEKIMEEVDQITEKGLALKDYAMDLVITYGPKFVGALIVLIIGLWAIKWILKLVTRGLSKSNVDDSLVPFLRSLIGALLKVMLGISIMTMLGIEMTSFIAILGAAGLAVGMALSGTLQNFAGGVMILLFKPFKVGDYVEAQGYAGVVKEIQIFVTILTTPDNKTIILPNGPLSNGSMINYSTQVKRRVDWSFGISYNDDLEKAKSIIREILEADERVIKEDDIFVRLGAMADSSVNITTRAWAASSDYWPLHFDVNERVYAAFNQKGISIPFPQMDVHIHNN